MMRTTTAGSLFFAFLASMAPLHEAGSCTIGVFHGSVTSDGRPVLWRNTDGSGGHRQQLAHFFRNPFNYLGVRGESRTIHMGVNEEGLACGHSYVVTDTPSIGGLGAFDIQINRLRNSSNLQEVDDYIHDIVDYESCDAPACFAFIDSDGNAAIYETDRSNWVLSYDSMNLNRIEQNLLGIVNRANSFHQREDGLDNEDMGGRYQSANYNALGLIQLNRLSIKTIIQGCGGENMYEVMRYGPGRDLSTIARGSGTDGEVRTVSAMIVHGVASGEDPALTTAWVVLGHPNYGIAVPAWVKVSDIPEPLTSGSMYDRSISLFLKGDSDATQASIFPAERHLLNTVIDYFLPYWRTHGVPSEEDMTRIQHRMTEDAYSLLDCLDNHNPINKAPVVVCEAHSDGLHVAFHSSAYDPDGTIIAVDWDFGDGHTSSEPSPEHIYAEAGTYLVSCTVTDDDNVTMTDWLYLSVNVIGASVPALVSAVNMSDGGEFTIQWETEQDRMYHIDTTTNLLGPWQLNAYQATVNFRSIFSLPRRVHGLIISDSCSICKYPDKSFNIFCMER